MKLRLPKQLCAALVAAVLTSVSQQTFADTTVATGETLVVGSGTTSSQFGTITVQNGAGIRLNDGATVDARFSYDSGAHISLEVSEDATAIWNAAAHPNTAGTGVSSIVVGSNATLTVNSSDTADPAFVKGDVDSVITLNSDATLISNNALSGWSQTAYTTNRTLNLKSGSTWQVKGQEWLNNTIINLEGGNIELSALMNFERNLSSFHVLSSATAMSTITGSSWLNLGGGNTSRSSTVNGHQGDLFDVARGNFELDATNRADLEISAKIGNAGTVHTSTLIKAGNGVLRLTNTSSDYDRGTYIDAGTLISVGASLGTGGVEINAGALLQIESTSAISNALSGAGRVVFTQDARYSGDASGFTGTMALVRDNSNHNAHINISDTYTGNFEVQGRFDIHDAVFGGAQKIILNTDGVSNTTGFWSHDGATTLAKALEITGTHTAELFLSSDVTLNANLTAAASSTLKISNGATLYLNGAENTVGSLNISSGKIQLADSAKLTFRNSLNGGSLNLEKVTGTGTIALTEQHEINSASAATVTLASNFNGALNYQGSINYNSNLGGASKVVFGGTSNILYADSTPEKLQEFSKNIELADGATLGLTSWGNASRTAVNVVSGSIKGGTNTTITKTDGGGMILKGDLSEFHGTFSMSGGNHGFTINVAEETATNTTDATFTGGLELLKTGAGELTLSGALNNNANSTVNNADTGTLIISGTVANAVTLKNSGTGTLKLSGTTAMAGTVRNSSTGSVLVTGTIAAGSQVYNDSTGSFVLDNATLSSGNGRLNIKGGIITFRNGITDYTTEGNNYAITVEGHGGTAYFTTGEYDFSSKNLAVWEDDSFIKVGDGATVKAGSMFWSPDGKYGSTTVESGGTLIVGQGDGALVKNDRNGVSHKGRIQVKNLTNAGTTELHGYADINKVSNNGGTLNLLGTESKAFGTFTQSGSDSQLQLGSNLTLETVIAENGTLEGSLQLDAGAHLTIKELERATTANLNNLVLADGAVLSGYTASAIDAAQEGTINVAGTLTATGNAHVNANLTFSQGAKLDITGSDGVIMGSAVTFATGNSLQITGAASDTLAGFTLAGQHLTLFSGVDVFNVGGTAYNAADLVGTTTTITDFSSYIDLTDTKYDNVREHLVLKFDVPAGSQQGGAVYLWMETPEPATATLSLLALAALAARRKRK